MNSSSLSAVILAAGLIAWAPAIAQPSSAPTPPGTTAAQKQPTQADGPPSIGPASGAYKETSDPKGWDAATAEWHKQHTDARESIGYVDQKRREAHENIVGSADAAGKP